jgi:hypothetical protein
VLALIAVISLLTFWLPSRIVAFLMDFVNDGEQGELDIELEIWSGHIGWGAGM